MSWIDISVPLRSKMPVWPGSAGVRLDAEMRMGAGDPANVSTLECGVHTGTHVDAPLHFVDGGMAIDEIDTNRLIGPTLVVGLENVDVVTRDALEALDIPAGTRRLLLRTRNSRLWSSHPTEFRPDYVALTAEAARWVVDAGIGLIGIDYLSIQRYDDAFTTHRVLLEAGVVILEGVDLSGVELGRYELICTPLRLEGAEAAPARALLRPMDAAPND